MNELPEKEGGCPLLLGEELEKQARVYLTSYHKKGAVINTVIVIACSEGIVKGKDCNLLVMVGTFFLQKIGQRASCSG